MVVNKCFLSKTYKKKISYITNHYYLCPEINIKRMKNNLLKLLIVCIGLFSDFAVYSQIGNNDDNGNLEGNDPPAAPINTKLILLAVAGIFFAIHTFKNNRKTI